MTHKSEIGKFGEDTACDYLKKKGYNIIERNFKKPWGEIDIISKDPHGILVFVEVKTMRKFGNKFGNAAIAALHRNDLAELQSSELAELLPEENLTKAKLKKFQRMAMLYAGANPELVSNNGWRLDLIAISIQGDKHEIKHFENI